MQSQELPVLLVELTAQTVLLQLGGRDLCQSSVVEHLE